MSDAPFYVECLIVGTSANASQASGSPFVVTDRRACLFDFDTPSVQWVTYREYRKGQLPTLFASKEEAELKVEALLDRVRAIQRISRGGGTTTTDVGQAVSLIPRDMGKGPVGGYEIVPYRRLRTAWEENDRQRAIQQARAGREKLEAAQAKAAAALAEADRIAAEVGADAPSVSPDTIGTTVPERSVSPDPKRSKGSSWVGVPGETGVQHRVQADGTPRYRARFAGQVSESLETLDEAKAAYAEMSGNLRADVGAQLLR